MFRKFKSVFAIILLVFSIQIGNVWAMDIEYTQKSEDKLKACEELKRKVMDTLKEDYTDIKEIPYGLPEELQKAFDSQRGVFFDDESAHTCSPTAPYSYDMSHYSVEYYNGYDKTTQQWHLVEVRSYDCIFYVSRKCPGMAAKIRDLGVMA